MKLAGSLKGFLLGATALASSSGALAQDNVVGPNYEITDQIIVRGVNIPDPQRATSQVATFLSAEDLARTGDATAAEALKRLSGLSVVGGKFAFVRGLGDRYSSARLNGSPLPSPEPLRRTVPLDLFPSEILGGATVQKTFSPNYPGEFGGGIIDLETLRIPNEPFLNVKFGIGANTVTTANNGLFVNGGDLDWLGYDDGLRSVPGPLQTVIDSDVELEDLDPAVQEAIGESLVNSPLSVIQNGNLGPNYEASVDGGTVFDLDGGLTLGLTGVIGYRSNWVTEEAVRQLATSEEIGIDSTQTETSLNTTVNGLLSGSLEWTGNLVQLTALYIHDTRKEAQITRGRNFNIGSFLTEENSFLERALWMGQAAGEHDIGEQFAINWRGAFARSTRDSPYERGFIDRVPNVDDIPIIQPFTTRHVVAFSELEDDTWSGGADLFWFIPVSGAREATLSAGYEYVDNDREFIRDPFQFITNTALPFDVASARVDFAYSPDNIDPSRFRLVDVNTQGVNNYLGELTVHAAYAQLDAELIPTLRTTVGVRYETAEQSVDVFDRFGNPTTPDQPPGNLLVDGVPVFNQDTRIENDYWLPSATVTWNFTDDMQLRLGYSHTVARPQFRELAASEFLDPDTDRRFFGNPFLQDSEFRNYDARYEFYLGRNQFLTLAGFYKDIENPIDEIQFSTTDFGFASTFINSPEARLFGGEFEYRTNFEIGWNDWFQSREWLFSVNYTYTNSEIRADENDLIVERNGSLTPGDQFGLDGQPLVGTPEHIANAQFGWESDQTQFTLLVGWVDERLLARGERLTKADRLLDVVERPGVQMDATFRQQLEIRGADFTIGLSARNLLGTRHIEFQDGTADPLAVDGFVNFNTYNVGRTLSATLTGNF
ncbi:MAG: TonB-dependent receptor [Pseudomonadota bacterium]